MSANKYFKFFNGTTQIYSQKSKGMSKECIKNITTSDNTLAPTLENKFLLIITYKIWWKVFNKQ